MRPSESLIIASLILATHAPSAYALVAAKPASAFSLDILPFPTHKLSQRHDGQFGSVPTTPSEGRTSYFSPVTIGNQTFQMLLDTGSADLWVYSNSSPPSQNDGHTTYIPSASATLLQNYTWSIAYVGGQSASGIVYTDTVSLGPVVARCQAVEAATDIPFFVEPDGILGLGSSKINQVKPVKQKTFFETVAPTLQKKVFAFAIPEKVDFGFLDAAKYVGDIVYTPNVQPDKYWTMSLGRFSVGSGAFSNTSIGPALVDSGTTNVYIPLAATEAYYSQIPSAKQVPNDSGYYFPCNATLPDFHFEVEGRVFTLTGQMVNKTVFYQDQCLGLLNSDTKSKRTILGNTFMQHFYVVFSAEEEGLQLGLAKRAV